MKMSNALASIAIGTFISNFALASIPSFKVSQLPGRYSCKTGDRQSRTYYTIKNLKNTIEFHIDKEEYVFKFNKKELQQFFDTVEYSEREGSGVFRAVDAVEDSKNGGTDYFSYELIYNSSTQDHSLASFTLSRESGSIFTRDIDFSCVMITKENE